MRFAFDDDATGDNDDADELDLDRDFPLGDDQSYVEDCQVCCQPWRVSVHYRSDGTADVTATALDE